MKRLIFCFDGTWNSLGADNPTNVVLTAASILRETANKTIQIIHYDEGVGTGRLEKFLGGVCGAGLYQNIREAYRFLVFNHDPGDEIFVFGFSRGAFTARTFVGLVRHVGRLDRLHAGRIDDAMQLYIDRVNGLTGTGDRMRAFRASYSSKVCIGKGDDLYRCSNVRNYTSGDAPLLDIKFLGLWDTVKAIGWPDITPGSSWLNRRERFHDASLDDFVLSARHAVAIDEHRALFPAMLLNDLEILNARQEKDWRDPEAPYQERWFPGTHGSVGGGGDIRGLSDGALAWVLAGAKNAGLKLDTNRGTRIHGLAPNSSVPLINEENPKWSATSLLKTNRSGPDHIWQLSNSAVRRWHSMEPAYRPKTLSKVADALNQLDPAPFKPHYEKLKCTYTIQPGDSLIEIAKHFYGDPTKSIAIFEANRDTLDNEQDIFANTEIRIPEITSATSP